MTRLYADHNATAPLRPEAAAAISEALGLVGNPSSVHGEGRAARAALETARENSAALLGGRAQDLILTSGATEGLQLALDAALAGGFREVFVSAGEHDAIFAYAARAVPTRHIIPLLADGRIDLDWLAEASESSVRPLFVVQAANNETGIVQDLRPVAELARERGGALLVDAAQAFGKLDAATWAHWGAWTVASGHKLGAPAGIGAVLVQCDAPFPSVRPGGGQERGRRSGTHNLLGAIGFAAAAQAAASELASFQRRAGVERDAFEAAVKSARPDAIVFDAAPRLANTSCIALPGWSAERQVIALDLAGAAVSAGAACSSGTVRASRVLSAMGANDVAASSAIRASFGWSSAPGDGERLAQLYLAAAERALPRKDASHGR